MTYQTRRVAHVLEQPIGPGQRAEYPVIPAGQPGRGAGGGGMSLDPAALASLAKQFGAGAGSAGASGVPVAGMEAGNGLAALPQGVSPAVAGIGGSGGGPGAAAGGTTGAGGMGAASTVGPAALGALGYAGAIEQSRKWAGDTGKWLTTANPIYGTQISALIRAFK